MLLWWKRYQETDQKSYLLNIFHKIYWFYLIVVVEYLVLTFQHKNYQFVHHKLIWMELQVVLFMAKGYLFWPTMVLFGYSKDLSQSISNLCNNLDNIVKCTMEFNSNILVKERRTINLLEIPITNYSSMIFKLKKYWIK